MRQLCELEIDQVAGAGPITDLPEIQTIQDILENGSCLEGAASFPAAEMLDKALGGIALGKAGIPTPGVGAATTVVDKTIDVFDTAFTSILNNVNKLLNF